jgi:hypothetical protein
MFCPECVEMEDWMDAIGTGAEMQRRKPGEREQADHWPLLRRRG